jgi:transposase
MEERTAAKRRHIGIDVGKRTYAMAVIGTSGGVKHSNGKTSAEGRAALCGQLEATDRVAIEAGNMAFILAKELRERVGCEVVVLNASKLALIYGSMKKTDKEDSLKLARIIEQFRDEQLPTVPVPSDQELERRKLIAGYNRAVKQRTQMVNLLHGLFLHLGITKITRKDLKNQENREAAIQQLSGQELSEAAWALQVLELHEKRIAELKQRMEAEAKGDGQIERLKETPGVGTLVALAFAAYIGDGSRFENASQVSNYLGLVPRVDISGTLVKYGGITKRGNSYLRVLLVQAAWAMLRSKTGSALKERYEYMTQTKGLGKKKTIVAIARRLAELLWTLSRSGDAYEQRRFKRPSIESLAERLAKEALAG